MLNNVGFFFPIYMWNEYRCFYNLILGMTGEMQMTLSPNHVCIPCQG